MQQHEDTHRRFGNRATIDQPGMLVVNGRVIDGMIENVGLSGAFFATAQTPAAGSRVTLHRDGGRGIECRVVWQRRGSRPGVGLSFG